MAEVLAGRYELGDLIGRGGMATVHEGRDTVLGRRVAIKLLAERYAGDAAFVERFRREAQASGRLNHPNIVSVYDTGDEAGAHFIVMELVEGRTLAEVLRAEGRLTPERVARIGAAVAHALDAAHRQGIVHRDVKPGNVMLTAAGDVKVMDFGIARAAEDDTLTQAGTVLGTASYLSPEQSRGDPVDSRSDVYALGCLLYEMVAGRPPFTGDSPLAIAYRHVNDRPEPPSRVDPAVPAELDEVLIRALEKDPDRRFESAAAFADALTGAATGVPTAPLLTAAGDGTDVLPAVAPDEPPSRRRVPVLAWAVLVLVAVAAAAVALASGGDDAPTERRRERREARRQEPRQVTLGQAVGSLEELVEGGVAAGALPEEVGAAILTQAALAQDAYATGDLDAALEALAGAESVLAGAAEEGLVTDPELTEAVAATLATIESLMRADPPPEPAPVEEDDGEGEGEDEGDPGNSEDAPGEDEGKGKAKGKDKDKDDEKDDD